MVKPYQITNPHQWLRSADLPEHEPAPDGEALPVAKIARWSQGQDTLSRSSLGNGLTVLPVAAPNGEALPDHHEPAPVAQRQDTLSRSSFGNGLTVLPVSAPIGEALLDHEPAPVAKIGRPTRA